MLVVDDDDNIRSIVALAFQLEGFEVASACDGIEAIAAVESFHPDVMVVDIMMPRLDGLSVLGRLRADTGTAQIPVVLLSAKADSADVAIGRRAGASDYVTKPFDTDELLERVQKAMVAPVPVSVRAAAMASRVDQSIPDTFVPLSEPVPEASIPLSERFAEIWDPRTAAIIGAVVVGLLVVALVVYLLA
ncbi:MAG: hypothetical protein NVS3B21_21150 [Acidimicrobiales bacterium]